MSRVEPPAPGPPFKVAIVGAGGINFGTDEGPWNHSFRLEKCARFECFCLSLCLTTM